MPLTNAIITLTAALRSILSKPDKADMAVECRDWKSTSSEANLTSPPTSGLFSKTDARKSAERYRATDKTQPTPNLNKRAALSSLHILTCSPSDRYLAKNRVNAELTPQSENKRNSPGSTRETL